MIPQKNSLFFLLSLLVLCIAAPAQATNFRIIFNNDNMGELDGCG